MYSEKNELLRDLHWHNKSQFRQASLPWSVLPPFLPNLFQTLLKTFSPSNLKKKMHYFYYNCFLKNAFQMMGTKLFFSCSDLFMVYIFITFIMWWHSIFFSLCFLSQQLLLSSSFLNTHLLFRGQGEKKRIASAFLFLTDTKREQELMLFDSSELYSPWCVTFKWPMAE